MNKENKTYSNKRKDNIARYNLYQFQYSFSTCKAIKRFVLQNAGRDCADDRDAQSTYGALSAGAGPSWARAQVARPAVMSRICGRPAGYALVQ